MTTQGEIFFLTKAVPCMHFYPWLFTWYNWKLDFL